MKPAPEHTSDILPNLAVGEMMVENWRWRVPTCIWTLHFSAAVSFPDIRLNGAPSTDVTMLYGDGDDEDEEDDDASSESSEECFINFGMNFWRFTGVVGRARNDKRAASSDTRESS